MPPPVCNHLLHHERSRLAGSKSQKHLQSRVRTAFYGITDATAFNTVSFSVAGNGLIAIDDVSSTAPVGVTATPEPASIALVATGLLGVAGVVRRRRPGGRLR